MEELNGKARGNHKNVVKAYLDDFQFDLVTRTKSLSGHRSLASYFRQCLLNNSPLLEKRITNIEQKLDQLIVLLSK